MTSDPIVKTLHVPLDPDAAFDLFTTRIGAWWPADRFSISAADGKLPQAVEFEDGVGGEIVELAHDGSRHLWGTVTAWTPGEGFAATWHPGRSKDAATHLAVTFENDGDGTLITLTHSGWQSLGHQAATLKNEYFSGWDIVLGRLSAAA